MKKNITDEKNGLDYTLVNGVYLPNLILTETNYEIGIWGMRYVQTFVEKVKKQTTPTELTSELVHEFIEKILVHKPEKINGKRYQEIEIHYNGVGIVHLTAEHLEAAFQNGNFMGFELIKEETEKTA